MEPGPSEVTPGVHDKVRVTALKPLDAQVVLVRIKNDVSEGGIIIPQQALDRASTFWRVVAVGPGRWENGSRRPVSVAVDDLVAMIPIAHLKGGEVVLTDADGKRQTVLVIHEDAIVAVVS